MKHLICFLMVLVPGIAVAQIQVTIPEIGRVLGLGPKTEIVLVNDTPFYGTVTSMNENLGDFDPGAALTSRTSHALGYSPVIVAVLFYGTPARDHLVGIAVAEVWVRRGETQAKTFRLYDVRFLNGSYAGYRDAYPTSPRGKDREIDIPMMSLMSTTWVLWANATLFDVEVRVNGRGMKVIPSGGLHWFEVRNIAEVNRALITEMVCLDGGRVKGIQERQITPGYSYPTSYAFLMDANWFPRY